MSKRMGICMDDFGLSPEINAAALELTQAGVVTAVSCMSTAPHWPEGAAALRSLPHLNADVGLHLNFTEPLPGHSESSCIQPLWRLILNTQLRRIDAQAISREIQRQFDAFEAHWGKSPDFVDGHQHIHQFPVVRECLLQELDRRRVANERSATPWLRNTQPRAGSSVDLKHRIIEVLGSQTFAKMARARGYALNAAFTGVYDFSPQPQVFGQRFEQWLQQSQDGDLLMCHPAKALEGIAPSEDGLRRARLNEFEFLIHSGAQALEQAHAQAVRPSAVLSGGLQGLRG